MAQRGFLVVGASVLLFVAGACTLSTSGIDTGETGGFGAGTGSSSVGSGGAGGGATTGSTTTSTTTGTGGAAPCTTDAQCPAPAACVKYSCPAGACVPMFAPEGTPVMGAPPGDCKKLVCDGAGAPALKNDDGQMPDDKNPCTSDSCENGQPKHPPLANGTACGGGLACKDGQCMGCTAAAQCPMGDVCHAVTCIAGACGFDTASLEGQPCAAPAGACFDSSVCAMGACVPQPKGAAVFSDGTDGNCKSASCDGNGVFAVVNDDNDAPPDANGNDCSVLACNTGAVVQAAAPDGQACGNPGQHCCAGACQYGGCCPVAQKCGAACCQANQVCDGTFCCTQDKLCGGGCCDPGFGFSCIGGSKCCATNKVCGNNCCGFLQSCVNGSCQ